MKKLSTYILLPVLAFAISCSAPHNNPLDPENPDSDLVRLSGNVQSVSVPRQDLADVEIFWQNDDLAVRSDVNGDFLIDFLQPKDGWIFFEKEGYHRDSLQIAWQNRKEAVLEMFMNAEPALDALSVYSVVVNKFPFIQEFEFSIRAVVSDPDADIESVSWAIPQFDVSGDLKFNVDQQLYEIDFDPADEGLGNEEVVGYDFLLTVTDKSGRKNTAGTSQIARVIKEEVLLIEPVNSQIVNSTPTLSWQRFDPGFPFSYEIQLLEDIPEDLPELYREYKDIDASLNNFEIAEVIEPGNYFWTVWVIDEFGNRARSRAGSFQVQ